MQHKLMTYGAMPTSFQNRNKQFESVFCWFVIWFFSLGVLLWSDYPPSVNSSWNSDILERGFSLWQTAEHKFLNMAL